jgi:hypothetical protein
VLSIIQLDTANRWQTIASASLRFADDTPPSSPIAWPSLNREDALRVAGYTAALFFGRPRQRDNLVIMKTRDMSEYMRAYRAANAEKLREYNRAYRAANREKKREYNRKHRLSNPEAYREYQRQYRRNRYANDPEFRERLKERVRQRARRQAAISSNPSSSRGSVGDEGE